MAQQHLTIVPDLSDIEDVDMEELAKELVEMQYQGASEAAQRAHVEAAGVIAPCPPATRTPPLNCPMILR